MMKQRSLVGVAGLLFVSAAAASGYRPPAHSDLTYSFTCPSGASGHLRYVVDFQTEFNSKLTMWVNGQHIHDDPMVSAGLGARSVEQLQASCGGDSTLVFLMVFDPEKSKTSRFTITVDRSGAVTSAEEEA